MDDDACPVFAGEIPSLLVWLILLTFYDFLILVILAQCACPSSFENHVNFPKFLLFLALFWSKIA